MKIKLVQGEFRVVFLYIPILSFCIVLGLVNRITNFVSLKGLFFVLKKKKLIELENEFIHQVEYFIDFYIWATGEIGGDIGGRGRVGKQLNAGIIKSLIAIILFFFC